MKPNDNMYVYMDVENWLKRSQIKLITRRVDVNMFNAVHMIVQQIN